MHRLHFNSTTFFLCKFNIKGLTGLSRNMIFVWWSDINFLLQIRLSIICREERIFTESILQCLRRFFPHFPLPGCCWHSCALPGKLISRANSLQTLAHQPGALEHAGIPGIFMASLNFQNVSKHLGIMIQGDTNISIRHKRIFLLAPVFTIN